MAQEPPPPLPADLSPGPPPVPPPLESLPAQRRPRRWWFALPIALAVYLLLALATLVQPVSVAGLSLSVPVPGLSTSRLFGLPDRPFTIAVVGLDIRPTEQGPARTDSILLLRIDPGRNRAGVLSIPRDAMMQIPATDGSVFEDRVNTAYVYNWSADDPEQAPAALAQTIEHNLGLTVDYYVVFDQRGAAEVIDAAGGGAGGGLARLSGRGGDRPEPARERRGVPADEAHRDGPDRHEIAGGRRRLVLLLRSVVAPPRARGDGADRRRGVRRRGRRPDRRPAAGGRRRHALTPGAHGKAVPLSSGEVLPDEAPHPPGDEPDDPQVHHIADGNAVHRSDSFLAGQLHCGELQAGLLV